MGREAMIKADMEAVGTYSPIFDKAIKSLAKQERELAKAEKTWRDNGGKMVAELVNKTGATYTAKDPALCGRGPVAQGHSCPARTTWSDAEEPEGHEGEDRRHRHREAVPSGRAAGGGPRVRGVEHAAEYQAAVDGYVSGVLSGEIVSCEEIVLSCQRYMRDLENPKWEFRSEPACEVVAIIETMMCHQQGEFMDGNAAARVPVQTAAVSPVHRVQHHGLLRRRHAAPALHRGPGFHPA